MSVVEADCETVEELSEAGLGTRVVHRCVAATPSTGLVAHVVLPPRTPGSTPFTNLRDAGWTVEVVNPLDLRGCSSTEYGTQVLLSRSNSSPLRGATRRVEGSEKN